VRWGHGRVRLSNRWYYTYTWGADVDADSYTVDIEAPAGAVPEPGSLTLFGSALALLASRRRRGERSRDRAATA
jgi:PEP-CTERM motif